MKALRPRRLQTKMDLTTATMSICDVKLLYEGPLEVVVGSRAVVSVGIDNASGEEAFFASGIDDRVGVSITVLCPDRRAASFVTKGKEALRAGNNIASLLPGESLRETVDVASCVDMSSPGTYLVTVTRRLNGVIRFPEHKLIIKDVPIVVVKSPEEDERRTPSNVPRP